jgi:hypothetical protein
MSKKKPKAEEVIDASIPASTSAPDPVAGDVRAWLAALRNGEHVSSAPAQTPLPATPEAPHRRRPRPAGGYVGKNA